MIIPTHQTGYDWNAIYLFNSYWCLCA